MGRLLESKLPPPTDEFCMSLREQLVDAQEFEEWRQREDLIKELQAKRLELVKAALEERELAKEKANEAKIDRVRAMCLEWRDRGLDEVQQRRLKVVRQTDRESKKLRDKLYPPDKSLVHRHFDTGSTLWGPNARDGHVPETKTAKIDVQPSDLDSFGGLSRLEKELRQTKPRLFNATVPDYQEHSELTKSRHSRRQYERIGTALQSTFQSLTKLKAAQGDASLDELEAMATGANLTLMGANASLMQQQHGENGADVTMMGGMGLHTANNKTLGSLAGQQTANATAAEAASANDGASTGVLSGVGAGVKVSAVTNEDEDQAQSLLLLQRLIRGRARQVAMLRGRDRRMAMIAELRAKDKLRKAAMLEESLPAEAKEKLVAAAVARAENEAAVSILEAVGGQVVSDTLDALSRELTRFEELRRVAAMARLAERQRRGREAAEAGRRQAEEILRLREDEMFRQVMGHHHSSVDSYLEHVLSTAVSRKARADALTEAKLRAEVINAVVDEIEEATSDPHTAVRELVSSFLLPHAKRNEVKLRVQQEQRRFADAAKAAAEAALKNALSAVKEENGNEGNNGAAAQEEAAASEEE